MFLMGADNNKSNKSEIKTITLDPETLKLIRIRQAEKIKNGESTSFSKIVRELVEIGLKHTS